MEDSSNLEIYNQHIKKNDSMNYHGGTLLSKVIFGVKMLTNVTPESIYDKTADSPYMLMASAPCSCLAVGTHSVPKCPPPYFFSRVDLLSRRQYERGSIRDHWLPDEGGEGWCLGRGRGRGV